MQFTTNDFNGPLYLVKAAVTQSVIASWLLFVLIDCSGQFTPGPLREIVEKHSVRQMTLTADIWGPNFQVW